MVVMDMRSSTEYVLQEGALKAAATCARIQFDAHALLLNHFEPFVKFQEAVGDMMLFVSRGSHVGLVAAVHFAAALETLLKGLCRVSVVQGNVCFTNINGVPRLFGGSVNMACRIQSFTSEGTIAVQESCWRAFERASVSIAWSSKSETSKLDGDREVLDGMCTKRLLRLKGFRDEVSCVFVDASAMTEAFFRAVDVDSRCSVSHQNIEVRHDMT
jgi:class 3 adenylate cyclase